MDIWIKDTNGSLLNLSTCNLITEQSESVVMHITGSGVRIGQYATEQRANEVIQLIQDHINAIGTNNFNNLPMVYVMPIE